MAGMVKLRDLAPVIRSKNAGPFRLTFDVLFDDEALYEHVRDSGAFNEKAIAAAYGVPQSQISSLFHFDAARALKVTFFRPTDQCAIGESDAYGCQQHVPLMDLEVPNWEAPVK